MVQDASTTPPLSFNRVLACITLAGLLGGALDIIGAMVVYGPVLRMGAAPETVLQVVASGLLGRAAFSGGLTTALIGLAAHMGISFVAAAVYVLASMRLPILNLRPIICGLLFGCAVYFFMTQIVVPLSHAATRPPSTVSLFLIALSLNVFLFGLPIALVSSALSRNKPS